MILKRFLMAFLLVFILIILQPYHYCLAQYTYNPNSTLPYISTNTASQTYPYWPTGSYIDPYAQIAAYSQYSNTLANPFLQAYMYQISNIINPYLSYNPYGALGYSSSIYNPFGSYGLPSVDQSGIYNPGYYSQAGAINASNGTNTDSYGYTAQAATYYPTIGYTGVPSPLQLNLYGLPNLFAPYIPNISNVYQNPFISYLPLLNYFQNPYASYPYNNIQQAAVNPYQTYTTTNTYTQPNPYAQTNTYTQPLPYYQTNYTSQATTATAQGTLLTISGNWIGTWFTTLASGEVNTGEATLSLNQIGAELTGTVSFKLNGYPKLSSNMNGTITGAVITLVGSLFNGSNIYSITLNGNISAGNLSGTYTVTNNSGSVIESGTYNLARAL